MSVGINYSSDIGGMINIIGQYILGDISLIGVWLVLIFIGLGLAFDLDFTLVLVFIIPLVLVCLTFGLIVPVIGGAILIFDAFILSMNFIFRR